MLPIQPSDYEKYVSSIKQYIDAHVKDLELAQRIVLSAVPVLSLHESLRFPASVAMGLLDISHHESFSREQAIAAIALAGTVLQTQYGAVLKTMHDIVIEIDKVIKAVNKEDDSKKAGNKKASNKKAVNKEDDSKSLFKAENKEDISKSLFKIANGLAYLALVVVGGPELSIISFAMQGTMNLIKCLDQFGEDRWIEALSSFVMAGAQFKRCVAQYDQLQQIEAETREFPKGKVLKVKGLIRQEGGKGTWWTENAIYSGKVSNNPQELGITNGLTKEDEHAANVVLENINKNEIISFKNCREGLAAYLEKNIPTNWEIIKSSPFSSDKNYCDITLYNKDQLDYTLATARGVGITEGVRDQAINFSDKQGNTMSVTQRAVSE